MIRNRNRKTIPVVTRIVGAAVLFVLFSFLQPLFPVEVKKKEVVSFDDFQFGEFKGTGLDSKGRLFIGPRIKQAPGPGLEYYLSLDTTPNGDIYVGTGHQATVYRISTANTPTSPLNPEAKPGSIKEIFRSEHLDVYALAINNVTGDIYVGTAPDGKLHKVSVQAGDKTEIKEIFDPEEKFIWDVKIDQMGQVICAVGNTGGVYSISPAGQSSRIFASEDSHIISLYITKNNSILAGSGDRGILYRIDNRKVKVLFDSPLEEIRGICEDGDGNIYFSATTGIANTEEAKSTRDEFLAKKHKKSEEKTRIKEKSILYCLTTGGTVEKIWTSETEYIYTAFYHGASQGVIIGTGNAGRVYRVKKDGSFAIIFESDSAQVYKIAANRQGFTLIANNTAAITTIENELNDKGVYYSDIYDLEIESRLGRIYWDAQVSAQTNVMLFIRTGNSNVPDSTWTEWSAPFTDPQGSLANVESCRYFQVKVVLNSSNASETPSLENFMVFYLQANLAPQVKKIEIKKSDLEKNPVVTSAGQEKDNISRYLLVSWLTTDQNNDKLKYNISLKKNNARNWVLIKEDITVNSFKLDTELYEDGVYLLQVNADDSLSNPPSLTKANTLVSSSFIIDSTTPTINGFSVTGEQVRFQVVDKTSIIAQVNYSFDGKLWFPVFPTDMLNDSTSETYDFQLKNLRSRQYIFLQVIDEYDNRGVFQQEF